MSHSIPFLRTYTFTNNFESLNELKWLVYNKKKLNKIEKARLKIHTPSSMNEHFTLKHFSPHSRMSKAFP